MAVVRHKAAIHSGHFMVSDFEPDEQDDEDTNVVHAKPSEEGSVALSNLIASSEEADDSMNNEIKPLDVFSCFQRSEVPKF